LFSPLAASRRYRTPESGTWETSVVTMDARSRAAPNSVRILCPSRLEVDAGAIRIVLSPSGAEKMCETLVVYLSETLREVKELMRQGTVRVLLGWGIT
jgi:hypothetical protein